MKKRNPFSPIRTKHVGVYYILGTDPHGKPRRTFYVQYYRRGKRHFEKVGHEGENRTVAGETKKLTATVANQVRADRSRGLELPNRERREADEAAKAAKETRWTVAKLAEEYFTHRDRQKAVRVDRNLFKRYLEDEFKNKAPDEVDPLSLDRFRKALSKRMTTKGSEKKPLSPTCGTRWRSSVRS